MEWILLELTTPLNSYYKLYFKKTHLEEDINDENVENVFEWDDNTIKDSLEFGHSVDGLQRSQDPEQLQAL